MAETQDLLATIEGPGVSVELLPRFHAASLRYFELDGAFAGMVRSVTGLNLPTNLGATHDTDAAGQPVTLLAWRSPRETTLLTTDAGLLNDLQTAAAPLGDGCVVDQCGGLLLLRARGAAVPELVAKRAGHGAMPAIGESRRTRFADVAVLIVKVRADETLLVVDRIYAPHVMASIRVSTADLDAPLFD
jgi:heterotetrameric sarcosine oxidase gamma subunit